RLQGDPQPRAIRVWWAILAAIEAAVRKQKRLSPEFTQIFSQPRQGTSALSHVRRGHQCL
ncbi:hypothetical protein, partial [Achromobacter spanius]|uniref:hypothetical protein n=1 Tax=Achromobacter spanius TaxID=217203 RepID=UPI003F68F82F